MKKSIYIVLLSVMIFFIGCSSNDPQSNSQDKKTTNEENESSKLKEDEESFNDGEKGDLTLQVLQSDKNDGLTLENNEFYKALLEEIENDPKMGTEDDISLYPHSVIELQDGKLSALFLMINRLGDPIKNIAFDLTFGNQTGDYVFENMEVDLPEELTGGIDDDGVIPLLLNMEKEKAQLFLDIEDADMMLEMDNVKMDFIE